MFEIPALPEQARPVAEVYADDDKLYQFFLDGTTAYMLFNKKVWNAGSNVSLRDIMSELYESVEPVQSFGRQTNAVTTSVFYEKLQNAYVTCGYVGVNIKTTN
jgi:hypothetical protein